VLGAKEAQALPPLLQAPAERFSIVHTCAPRALLTEARAAPDTPVGLVFVGALSDRKGVTPLLQACAALAKRDLPPWRLTLCGGGDVTSRQAEAAALGLDDHCSFAGHVNEQRVREELARNQIFVLPSFAEGLSVALLEAMALGCAVVATPVGEQESVLRNEANALVTKPGDVAALAEALARLIADQALARRLAAAARDSIATGFTNDHALTRVTQALRQAAR
jgi:glycosyltransferase involved in cell wall biosynthesis